jgi:hypothetical protein
MNADGFCDNSTAATEARFWPVTWSAVFVGALSALAVALLAGLASIAAGAQIVGHGEQIVSWNKVHFGGIIWAVCSAFFSFVVGGWIAGKIAGHGKAEPAMLHGAIAWLVTIPVFLLLAAVGAGGYFGAWYTGLAGTPIWAAAPAGPVATEAYAIVRNNALGALTALVLGLIGSLIGGWIGSGQLMTVWYHTTHDANSPASVVSSPVRTL